MSKKWLVHCVTSQGVHTFETNEEPADLSADDDEILQKDHNSRVARYSYKNREMNRIPGAMRSMNLDLAKKRKS